MRGQAEFALLLVLAAFTQLINISYVDGLNSDFSNMLLEITTDNSSYYADYGIVEMHPNQWIVVSVPVPEEKHAINVLSNADNIYAPDADPSIIEVTYQQYFRPDFSNMHVQYEGSGGAVDISYIVISMSEGNWAVIGLERPPEGNEQIIILATLDQIPGQEMQGTVGELQAQEQEPVQKAQESGSAITGTSLIDTDPVLAAIVARIKADLENQTDYDFSNFYNDTYSENNTHVPPGTSPSGNLSGFISNAPEYFKMEIFDSSRAKDIKKIARPKGEKYNFIFVPENYPVKEMKFRDLEIADGEKGYLGLEMLASGHTPFGDNAVQVFAIDPTELNFTEAEVTVTAKGTELYKCAEWDFASQTCNGDWIKIMDILPGHDYVIILNASDPAYAEYYHSLLGAPRCLSFHSPCIADSSLLMSRDALATPEPNAPNTIDSCLDGSGGTYGSSSTVENITITGITDSTFSPGDTIDANISVRCFNSSERVNIAYTNSTSSIWWKVKFSQLCPGAGWYSFNATFALDNVPGEHAVRAIIGPNTSIAPGTYCGAGTFVDNDDVSFFVADSSCISSDPNSWVGKLLRVNSGASYYVLGNVSFCQGTYNLYTEYPALIMGAEGHTLNCNGSTIYGAGQGTGLLSNYNNTRLRRCTFDGFETGINIIDIAESTAPSSTPAWVATWPNPATTDQLNAVAVDNDGNYVAVGHYSGSGNDWLIVKTDKKGNKIFEKRISPSTGDDQLHAIDIDGDGNYVIGGFYYSGAGQGVNWYVGKYYPNGTEIWNVTGDSGFLGLDELYDLDVDPYGDIAIAVAGWGGSGAYRDWFITRLNSTGAVQWTTRINPGPGNDVPNAIKAGHDGHYVVGGFWRNGTHDDLYVAKLHWSDGSILWDWNKSLSTNEDRIHDVVVDHDGNYLMAGNTGSSFSDGYLAKFAPDGTLLWEKVLIYGTGWDILFGADISPDGNYVVGGFITLSNRDWVIAKIDPDGNSLWNVTYPPATTGHDYINDIAVDDEGNIIAAGYYAASTTDPIMAKFTTAKNTMSGIVISNVSVYNTKPNTFLSIPNAGAAIINLSVGYNSTAGKIHYSSFANVDGFLSTGNFLVGPEFVSMNATETGDFNKSVNITLSSVCDAIQYYKAPGFPQNQSAITSTGSIFAPLYSSCSGNVVTFSTDNAFSGYTALSSFDITSCLVINSNGTYSLQNDLFGAPNTRGSYNACVVIESSNVTLDCNTYYIMNNETSDAIGIYVNGSYTNITVQNCPAISNYLNGILINGISNSTLSNNIVYYSSGASIRMQNVTYTNITNNTVYGSDSGIYVSGNSAGNLISLNTIMNNEYYGIHLFGAYSGKIGENTVKNNLGSGILLGGGTTNTYTYSNNISNNSEYGIQIVASSENNSFYNNTVINNSWSGISVQSSRQNITNNTVAYNSEQGIGLSGSHSNNISNNLIYNNSFNGILFNNANNSNVSYNSVSNNSINGIQLTSSGNNFSNNSIYKNANHGLLLGPSSLSNNLTGNDVFNNTLDGIHINSKNNRITAGKIYSNSRYGCYVDTGSNSTFINSTIMYDNQVFDVNLYPQSTGIVTNLSTVIFTSPSGLLQNFTNLSVNEVSSSTGDDIRIKWSSEVTPYPQGKSSFHKKFIQVLTSTASVESMIWHWTDAEAETSNENNIELWEYSTEWSNLGATLNTVSNTLTMSPFSGNGNLGIFESSGCPVITSPGTYTQDSNYLGSPNAIPDFSSS
ncbi:right-handed parallel beta-helix repeat-containing protein, partial [Candidatus Micrarchaeota archaeon]|nr:right-handed parallel beta-helix repeat-containing protein [Candidatus Micrarchaeota archaeon]